MCRTGGQPVKISPAAENTHSGGTDIAGMQRRTSFASLGNLPALTFHQFCWLYIQGWVNVPLKVLNLHVHAARAVEYCFPKSRAMAEASHTAAAPGTIDWLCWPQHLRLVG